MIIGAKRRTRKPPVGANLNFRDRRVRGLRYAFVFNENGGGGTVDGSLRNLALPHTATTLPTHGLLGSTTNITWTPRWNGALAYTSSTTSYVDCGANDDTTGEITWLAWVYPTTLPSLATLFGQNKADGSESIDSVYLTSGGNLSWWIHRAGGENEILNGSASSVAANTFYRLAGRRKGASGAWDYDQWINEELNDTATGSTLDPATNSNDGNFRVGFAGLFTGAPFVGDYVLFLLWHGVALKDDDVLSLSANPWQLWEPRAATTRGRAAAAGFDAATFPYLPQPPPTRYPARVVPY